MLKYLRSPVRPNVFLGRIAKLDSSDGVGIHSLYRL